MSCSEIVARFHETAFGIAPKAVTTIPYGVDCSVFVPCNKNAQRTKIRLGTVGRFVEMKGHRYLFEAIARLPSELHDKIDLVLAGDGPLRSEYEKWISELGIGECTQLLGAIRDVPRFLQSLDVYVQSSSSEALPIAILEAMACGLPIVATRVAGIPEQVVDGVNGFLVPPCDSAALAAAIARLCANHSLRERFGNASAQRARQFYSLEVMAQRLANLYTSLAHGASSRKR